MNKNHWNEQLCAICFILILLSKSNVSMCFSSINPLQDLFAFKLLVGTYNSSICKIESVAFIAGSLSSICRSSLYTDFIHHYFVFLNVHLVSHARIWLSLYLTIVFNFSATWLNDDWLEEGQDLSQKFIDCNDCFDFCGLTVMIFYFHNYPFQPYYIYMM